jgi:hypothetical protein
MLLGREWERRLTGVEAPVAGPGSSGSDADLVLLRADSGFAFRGCVTVGMPVRAKYRQCFPGAAFHRSIVDVGLHSGG